MIRIVLGDLAEARAEAVLRSIAADGSAVTPVMRRLELAAGPALAQQCERLGELPIGSAAITGAGTLAVQYMVHVVIRSRDEGISASSVRRALLNGLRRLAEWEIRKVALPPLGLGAGNLDAEEAAELMVPMLFEHLSSSPQPSEFLIFVENEYERQAFQHALNRYAGEAARGAGTADSRLDADPPNHD